MAFEVINWTGDQVGAYTTFVGVLVAAAAMFFNAEVAKQVTPVASPRDNGMVPLVPIANDGFED
jgi:hypothetical protein